MADGSITVDVAKRAKSKRVADLFCGAGGSSTGAKRALRDLGQEISLIAVNHWQVAIDTHTRNHPGARHHCTDLEHAKPLEVVPEGSLDLLIASPTCTFHSRARGGKPVNDQQRMDPWHVVRWCTELRVARLVIENVPEFVDWGPCSLVTGRPIPSRRGEYFRAWCAALRAIGFRIDHRILCCADYGDPTTRRRFILIGRSDRAPLRWPEPSHDRAGSTDLLNVRSRWRGAVEIIDWSLPGKSIFTRKKPLATNTLRRILAGAERYAWPEPYCAALRALLAGNEPVLDVSAEEAAPFVLRLRGTSDCAIGGSALDVASPIPALSAGGRHIGIVMATGAGGVARSLGEPIPTVTGGGDGGARPHFVVPLISSYYGTGTASPIDDPLPTVTTKGRFSVATPIMIQTDQTGGTARAKCVDEPIGTVVSKQNVGLASPFLVPNFGERPGQEPRTHGIDEPLPTVAATGHIQLAQPAIAATPTTYRIDILYRMLTYRELARAMSFDDEGEVYDFAGTATEITKQIGNAVPSRTAKALVRALMEGS